MKVEGRLYGSPANSLSSCLRPTASSPIFRELIESGLPSSASKPPDPPNEPPELDPASDDPFDELFEPPVEGKSGEQEIPDEPPDSKAARLLREAASNEHRLAHYPKTRIAASACNHACMPVGSTDTAMSPWLLGRSSPHRGIRRENRSRRCCCHENL